MNLIKILLLLFSTSVFANTFTADVKGMVCQMCVMGMRKSFGPYVKNKEKDISVDLEKSTLTVTLINKMEDKKIINLVKDAGYNAEKIIWLKNNAK